MNIKMLPDFLIQKIMMYNRSSEAELIKDVCKLHDKFNQFYSQISCQITTVSGKVIDTDLGVPFYRYVLREVNYIFPRSRKNYLKTSI